LQPIRIHIRENAFLAFLAARILRCSQVAVTIGHTIHLYGVSKAGFIGDERWLRHEVEHVLQYRRQGFVLFLLQYLWQSLRHGYRENAFERAARQSEHDTALLQQVVIG
jgi:hypothetical protein